MKVKFINSAAQVSAVDIVEQPQSVGEVQQKDSNIIKFVYSLQHKLSIQQIENFFEYAEIDYDSYDIHDILVNGKPVNVNVTAYKDGKSVCEIISMYTINENWQLRAANVPADKSVDYIIDMAHELCNDILDDINIDYFYISGQSTLCMHVSYQISYWQNAKCIEATSDRVSIDNPDGTKTSIFKHTRWRNIFTPELIK